MIHSLARRPVVAAAMLAGSLLMAGCGGSSHSPASTKTSTTGSTAGQAGTTSGSALAASLTKLMARNQPYLKKVKAHCPSAVLPANCSFTAIAEQPPVKRVKIKGLPPPTNKGGGKQRVAGTIKVTPAKGKSFSYSLTYAPAK
jgi:hypothetical protein